jgi:alkylhydroperoxidase family enzyme
MGPLRAHIPGRGDARAPARLAPALDDLVARLWRANDPVLLDLCRLRLGQLVGRDLPPRAAPPEKVAALRRWPDAPEFDDAERALLDFCEHYAIDAGSVTDAMAARLHQHFDEPTLAALTTGIAVHDALVRVANAQES